MSDTELGSPKPCIEKVSASKIADAAGIDLDEKTGSEDKTESSVNGGEEKCLETSDALLVASCSADGDKDVNVEKEKNEDAETSVLEQSLTICSNDLEHSTELNSDNEGSLRIAEDEDDDDDDDDRESDLEQSCSRARPYASTNKGMPTPSVNETHEYEFTSKKPIPIPKAKYATPCETFNANKSDNHLAVIKTNLFTDSGEICAKDISYKGFSEEEKESEKRVGIESECYGKSDSSSSTTKQNETSSEIPPIKTADPVIPVTHPTKSSPYNNNLHHQNTTKQDWNLKSDSNDHKDKRLVVVGDKHSSGQTNNNQQQHTGGKKNSNIPIGIAVAWQRLVTSNSSLNTNNSITSTLAPSTQEMSKPKDSKGHTTKHPDSLQSSVKIPSRPSSASPISIGKSSHKIKEDNNKSLKRGSCAIASTGVGVGGVNFSGANNSSAVSVGAKGTMMESNRTRTRTPEMTTSRPMPSSSVPPNLGLSYFHQTSSLVDYSHYGARSLTPAHSGQFPPTWQSSVTSAFGGGISDLSLPQGYSSPGAAYSLMQNQLIAHQYSNYSLLPHHYLSPGYEALRHQYEQLIQHHHHQQQQQQQQSEFLRHLHRQNLSQQLVAGYSAAEELRSTPNFPPSPRISIPLLSPSPTGGTPTPTPNSVLNSSHNLSMSNLSVISPATGSPHQTPTTTPTNWSNSAELFHHNSSAALSPKSLTSSSPSPVTVQNQNTEYLNLVNTIAGNNVYLGRKCVTPNLNSTINNKNNVLSSPNDAPEFQTSHSKHKSSKQEENQEERISESPEKDLNVYSHNTPKSTNIPKDDEIKLITSLHKHDFKRMDSLIERRESSSDSVAEVKVVSKERGKIVEATCDKQVDVKVVTERREEALSNPEQSPIDLKIKFPATTTPNINPPIINKKVKRERKQKSPFPNKSSTNKKKSLDTIFNEKDTNAKVAKVNKKPKKCETGESKEKAKKQLKPKPEINLNNNGESILKITKTAKPRVYKSKKVKETVLSCDPFKKCEEFKSNIVPDVNLPAKSTSFSKFDAISESVNDTNVNTTKPCLSQSTNFENSNNKNVSVAKKRAPKNKSESLTDSPPRKRKPKNQTPKVKLEKAEKAKAKLEKVEKAKEKLEKSSKVTKNKRNKKQIETSESSSTISNKKLVNPTLSSSTPFLTTTSNDNSPLSFASSSSEQQQGDKVIPLSYHNSPVTLILPRILPQTTTTTTLLNSNSHHHHEQQTSFNLALSSREVKIPALVPNPQTGMSAIEGTFQLHQRHEQNIVHNLTFPVPNNNQSTTTTVASSCDNELTNSDYRNNTITFIRDSPLTHPNMESLPSGLQKQQGSNIRHVLSYSQQHHFSLSPNPKLGLSNNSNSVTIRNSFEAETDHGNHLNLLATVAQEFGSREDLGKLASHSLSSGSRGGSLMSSPIMSIQSPEVNYLTASSTITSSSSTAVSSSLPSSPVAAKLTQHDEYEFTSEKEQGANELSPKPYKHPVWLKIPHIVPQAANKAAEKQQKKLDKKRKQVEKTDEKKRKQTVKRVNTEKPDKEKIKRSSKLKISQISSSNSVGEQSESTLTNKNQKPKKEKVDKICIKLSENPTLIDTVSLNQKTPIPSSSTNGVYSNVKAMKNWEETNTNPKRGNVSKTKEQDSLTTIPILTTNEEPINDSLSMSPKEDLIKKSKEEEEKPIITDDNCKTSPLVRGEPLDANSSPIPENSSFLTSSFTLTPPPTAKNSSAERKVSLFSPSGFEPQQESSSSSSNDKTPNWVSDPSYAASAIRSNKNSTTESEQQPATNNDSFSTMTKEEKKKEEEEEDEEEDEDDYEKYYMTPSDDYSSEDEEEENLMDYERRTASKFNIHQHDIPFLNGNNELLNSQIESFVPYTCKPGSKSRRQRHQIKPCLKPEPILRPPSAAAASSSSSSGDENSDAEVDLEVASLTNTIQKKGVSKKTLEMLHQFRDSQNNNNNSNDQQASNSNEAESNSTSIQRVITNVSTKRRLSSTTATSTTITQSNKHANRVGERRLSLNLETRQTHNSQEDIDVDYLTSRNNNHSNNKGENKQSYRRISTGSTSVSYLPKTPMPRKRASRSLTASSRSSAAGSIVGLRSSHRSRRESTILVRDVHMEETLMPGKIELELVGELSDEMRILTEIQGLFYTGKLKALQPPDVYGVTLDNERGAPPHLIFSAEEVLEKCIREKRPSTLTVGLRICAYWSPQYSGLYPGRVSTDFNPSFDPEKDLIPIEFDDGDTGMIKIAEIRLLPLNHPTRAYDPNPLLTLEKKHRKRRHSSANPHSGACKGEHEENDCGESYCVKLAKHDEEEGEEEDDDDDDGYWTWTGLGHKFKKPKSKKTRNKEFFKGIRRGDETINVGDSAIFVSHGNERPYIGRIEKFWETKGQKVVNVRWFYHPEEVKSSKRIPHLKLSGALFESTHIDENDVQTIARKCNVLPYSEFKKKAGGLPKLSPTHKKSKPKDLYYIAGHYDPYTFNLKMKV